MDAAIALGKPPVIVSIHSFTQAWKGVRRPWGRRRVVGQGPAARASSARGVARHSRIEVGDNVPYSGQLKGDTLYRHGTRRGLAHALVEVRQDLILGPEGQAEWAMRLATVLRKVLDETGGALHAIELHGSLHRQELKARRARQERSKPIDGREDQDRARGGSLPASRRASARADRRAEYRSHGARRVLPELPRQLVSGGGRGERPCPSARTRRGRSSTAWPTRSGRRSTRPRRRKAAAAG